MNKSVRNLIILVAVLFGLGIGSMTVGLALGGQFMSVGWGPYGFYAGPLNEAPAAPAAPAAPGVGNVQGDIQSLTLSLGACEAFIQEGDVFNLEVTGNGPEVRSEVKDGVWCITNDDEGWNWKWNSKPHQQVTITLPKGFVAKELSLDMGMGRMEADALAANTAYLSVGAGQLEIDNLTSAYTSISSGMGQVQIDNAALTGYIELDCGMGQIEMTIDGVEADYGYDCSVGMGEIRIGGATAAGMGGDMNRTVEGDNAIVASCGMGSVRVGFTK